MLYERLVSVDIDW